MLMFGKVTSKLLQSHPQASRTTSTIGSGTAGLISPPLRAKDQKLNELATSKLADIVAHYAAGDAGWQGYKESEVIAARQLLDLESQPIGH